jgi:hypothetical protein
MESRFHADAEAELQNAFAALEEERTAGRTERRCLRDGGHLVFEERGSGYVIRCQSCDFRTTGRGI